MTRLVTFAIGCAGRIGKDASWSSVRRQCGKNISANIVEALKVAKSVGRVIGVVGRDGVWQVADACVVVPTVNPATVTPHTEAFQAVVWHGMVSHPKLLVHEMKWESVK